MDNLKILFNKLEYFLPYIRDDRITKTFKLNRKCYLQGKVIDSFSFMAPFLFDSWEKEIASTNKFIFFDSHYSKEIVDYIKKINPTSKIIFYFWNIIDEKSIYRLDDSQIDEFWTFDKLDAEKYSLGFNPQFYTSNISLQKHNITTDILFVGQDKNRSEIIKKLAYQADDNNLNSEIYITENNKNIFSYSKYLNKVSQSNAILDIVKQNQTGLTLRCMEAMFFGKKLITNNQEIVNYDFYNPQNIFIYGKDSIKELRDFIYSPLIEISSDIIMNYDYSNWVKRFK